jgi:hypothetical protein
MLQKLLIALVMAGLSAVAGAETIYKWMDSSGQIHYTDLPPKQADAKLLGVYDHQVGDVDDEANGYENGDDYGNGEQGDDTSSPPAPATFPFRWRSPAAPASCHPAACIPCGRHGVLPSHNVR